MCDYIRSCLLGLEDVKKPSDMVSEGFSRIPKDQVKTLHKWLITNNFNMHDIVFYFVCLGREYTWMEGATIHDIHVAMLKVFDRSTEYSMPIYHKLSTAIKTQLL